VTELALLKTRVRDALVLQLEAALDLMVNAALQAREAATHSESRQEGKYDTRGLEASYLAGAQAKRAAELQDLIGLYRSSPLESFRLFQAEIEAETHYFFLVPKGGGVSLEIADKKIQVVTPQSPVGGALAGRVPGDEFDVAAGKQRRTFQVVDVL